MPVDEMSDSGLPELSRMKQEATGTACATAFPEDGSAPARHLSADACRQLHEPRKIKALRTLLENLEA